MISSSAIPLSIWIVIEKVSDGCYYVSNTYLINLISIYCRKLAPGLSSGKQWYLAEMKVLYFPLIHFGFIFQLCQIMTFYIQEW